MDAYERYQFDLCGFLLVKGLLEKADAARCLEASLSLQSRIVDTVDQEPSFLGHFGIRYHFDKELGCSSYKSSAGGGLQFIVDDFLNASSAFDVLVNHEPTMRYVCAFFADPPRIGSSELRFRHQSNITSSHMGGVIDARNRYQFIGREMMDCATSRRSVRDFDLLGVRIIYAVHDIPLENGPLGVIPGSHKANFFSPYDSDPTKEPGMVAIPMEAGDVLFFTENLRHSGLPNLLPTPRITLHLQIGPEWVASQSPAHWNGNVHVTPRAWSRYTAQQRAVLPLPSHGPMGDANMDTAQQEIRRLQREVALLQEELSHYKSQQSGSKLKRMVKALRTTS